MRPSKDARAVEKLRRSHIRRLLPGASARAKKSAKALELLNKRFGAGAIAPIVTDSLQVPCVSTLNKVMDDWLTGATATDETTGKPIVIKDSGRGVPRGRVIEIYGAESCLDSETFINYQVRHKDGTSANSKGGTISNLYRRFHSIERPGRGNYQREATLDCDFFTASMNEEGRIVRNKIVDVVSTGSKACIEIETASGRKVTATRDHNFAVGAKFVPAGDLVVGDVLYLHDNTPHTVNTPKLSKYNAEWLVKTHPTSSTKVVKDEKRGYAYTYRRLRATRAVVEADMNNLSVEEYRQRLNNGYTPDMKFLKSEMQVHHINEDTKDDRLENLVVMSSSAHSREHATERHNNLRFVVTGDKVVSIQDVGERDTYDIKMESPHNNYVANGLVVHNCGKTTWCLELVSAYQRQGYSVAFIDVEHALNLEYAAHLGIDLEEWLLAQPSSGEEALDIVIELAKAEIDLVIVDSVAALASLAEQDKNADEVTIGLQARMMSTALRKLTTVLGTKSQTTVVFVNQTREKIQTFGGFGPTVTTSGGKALRFYSSIRIAMQNVGRMKSGTTSVGQRSRLRAVKNKVATPFRDCYVEITFGEGITKVLPKMKR